MNKIILMGRLCADPEVRYSSTGKAVASFRIAVDRRFKREGQPDADFFKCAAFSKTAEFVEKYLKKGTKIVLDGEMQNNNYTDKHGTQHYDFQVMVNSLEFAESKKAAEQNGSSQGNAKSVSQAAQDDDFMDIPDDVVGSLPFN